MKAKYTYTRSGFEDMKSRLGAIDRELRLEALRNHGNISRHRIVESAKTKANDARRQRKQRYWETE